MDYKDLSNEPSIYDSNVSQAPLQVGEPNQVDKPKIFIPKPEIYLGMDIEANGQCPGFNSMLSFGFCAFTIDEGYIGQFGRNLMLLPGSVEDPETMDWWNSSDNNRKAYWETRKNVIQPQKAVHELDLWVEGLRRNRSDHKLVFFAGPAGFDWTFLYYYINYVKRPWEGTKRKSHIYYPACLDMRSYIAGMLKQNYRATGKGSYPSEWFGNFPHTHIAEDDSVEQSCILFNAMRQNLGLPKHVFKYTPTVSSQVMQP